MTDHVYQQLREHLAYLKLSAVAEQLAAALEQAETEQAVSYTRFLHDLLAVEVAATEQRRLDGRLRFASFPAAQDARAVRLRRAAVARPAPRRGARDAAVRAGEGQRAADRPARRREDDARHRARAQGRARRLPRLLHDRRRSRRPHHPRRDRGPLADHDALLERAGRPCDRRARLSADARRGRQPPLPGDQPPLRARQRDPDHQPGDRAAGARSSKTRPSPPRSSTACCTTRPSCRSTGTATACAATAPACSSSGDAVAAEPETKP